MFFFTRFHIPKLSLTDYEKAIEQHIEQCRLSSKNDVYQHQLKLKKHISMMASSIHQLKSVSSNKTIDLLETELRSAVLSYLNTNDTNMSTLKNTYDLLESELKKNKSEKVYSALCMVSNSLLFSIGVAAIIICAATMFTGPIGAICLGLGITMLSAAVSSLAAYSIYVDGKNLFNKQLNDLRNGVDFLMDYPKLITSDSHTPDDSPPPYEHAHYFNKS